MCTNHVQEARKWPVLPSLERSSVIPAPLLYVVSTPSAGTQRGPNLSSRSDRQECTAGRLGQRTCSVRQGAAAGA